MDEAAEARLLDAARRGSFEAFGEIIRRWRAPVHEFCLDVTGDELEASRITGDAFRRLMAGVSSLPTGAHVRPYVFRAAWRALDAAGWFVTAGDDALTPGEVAAFPGMSRSRTALAHLQLRQEISPGELATVLALTPGAASVVSERLPASLAVSLGRDAESEVQAFAARVAPPPPARAATQLKDELEEEWPEPVAVPETSSASAPPPPRKRTGAVAAFGLPLAAAAALLAALLLVPGSPLSLTRKPTPAAVIPIDASPTPSPTRTATPTPTPTSGRTPTPTSTTTGTALPATATETTSTPAGTTTPAPTPTATATATPTSSRTVTATPTPSPTATPTPTATATPTVCAPQIQVVATDISLPPSGQSTIEVFSRDSCGPANYAAASNAAWLSVSPAFGAIPGFESVTLQVVAGTPPDESPVAVITITGPSNSVSVTVRYQP